MSPVKQWLAVKIYLWLIKLPAQLIESSPVAKHKKCYFKFALKNSFNVSPLRYSSNASHGNSSLSVFWNEDAVRNVATLVKIFRLDRFLFLKNVNLSTEQAQPAANLLVQSKFCSRFSLFHTHLFSVTDCLNFYKWLSHLYFLSTMLTVHRGIYHEFRCPHKEGALTNRRFSRSTRTEYLLLCVQHRIATVWEIELTPD